MEKIFEEAKLLFGLNKILIITLTALMALFIGNNEYKSLLEGLLNLKLKDFSNTKELLKNIELSKVIFFLAIIFASLKAHRLLNNIFSTINSKNTSLIISIENIIRNFNLDAEDELSKRIESQKYTEEKYSKENSKIEYLHKISEFLFVIGFFFIFVSFHCGYLDLIAGLILVFASFYFIFRHQIEVLKIIPKYIAADIILNNSSVKRSVDKYFKI